MGSSVAFFLCGVAYSFKLYGIIHAASWFLTIGTVISCIITIYRFWPRYTKPVMKRHFYYFLVIFFGYGLLHELSYICTLEFVLLSIAISNRINGSLVIHTLAEKQFQHFDHVFIIGIGLSFVENYLQLHHYFQKILTFLFNILSFSKQSTSSSSVINELHFVPWLVVIIAFIHSIQEFMNYVTIVVAKDKKNKNSNKKE